MGLTWRFIPHENKKLLMHKGFLKIASLLGALSVILGAFAAHKIKDNVSADVLSIFETGVRYQMYHAIALFCTGVVYKEFCSNKVLLAGKFFIFGIIIFSGSLYLLTLVKAVGATNYYWLGAVTPLGGLFFIAGWGLLAKEFWQHKKN
jgi:uncharacterized membrane protein YgdD (TMEM256/DUF423 family)